MSVVSRWTQAFSRVGRDGAALSRALYREHASGGKPLGSLAESFKAILLNEARKEPLPNGLAVSLLRAEREAGLVKYNGLAEYLRQRQIQRRQNQRSTPSLFSSWFLSPRETEGAAVSSESGGGSGSFGTGVANADANANTAKIAFMITSSMKHDLTESLGYSSEAIRAMKPQQASLVLHHEVSPESYDEQIIVLEEAFEKEQAAKNHQQQAALEKDATRTTTTIKDVDASSSPTAHTGASPVTTGNIQTSDSEDATNNSSDGSGEIRLMLSSSSDQGGNGKESSSPAPTKIQTPLQSLVTEPATTHNDDDDGNESSPEWYEVVEVRESLAQSGGVTARDEIRQGLYRDRDEADLGLETRQRIQSRRDEDNAANKGYNNNESSGTTQRTTFVLRPIAEKDLR